MNNKQLEILDFLKKKIIGNMIIWEHDTPIILYFDINTKLFNIKIKSHTFILGDYDSIKQISVDLNHMLALAYELNSFSGENNND